MTPWVLLALVGITAGLFAGLWWGERNRRLDAQRLLAGRDLHPRPPAIVDGKRAPQRQQTIHGEPVQPYTPDPYERKKEASLPADSTFDEVTRQRMFADFMARFGVDEETAQQAIEEVQGAILGNAGLS